MTFGSSGARDGTERVRQRMFLYPVLYHARKRTGAIILIYALAGVIGAFEVPLGREDPHFPSLFFRIIPRCFWNIALYAGFKLAPTTWHMYVAFSVSL